MIAAVAEHGYHEVKISQIAAAAGVSRRTFYSYFSSKEECFLHTYEVIADHLREDMRAAGAAETEWPQRVRAELDALLESLSANPDLVRFCMVAAPSAGGEIAVHYRTFLESLLALMSEGKPAPPATRQPSEAAEYGLIGGLAALLVDKVKAGQGERLGGLLPDLLELVLTPYLGREDAVRAARPNSS